MSIKFNRKKQQEKAVKVENNDKLRENNNALERIYTKNSINQKK